jgi:pimeloyl-[acyl-carrier protein] methyl ester esterase
LAFCGWIAINGFPRFVPDCVTAAQLREMKFGMAIAAARTLQVFYARLGAQAPLGSPDFERLRSGLDELQDGDIAADIEKLGAPGLVLAARNDGLVPVGVSEGLGRTVRDGGILWHENGGHVLPQSDPAWCAKAIENFAKAFFG